MIQAIVTDFSRVLLFPADTSYTDSLNALNRKLEEENPNYDFWHYFKLNDELLGFYGSLSVPIYLFTSDAIQEHPAIRDILAVKIKKVISAKVLGVNKTDADAYVAVAEQLQIIPEQLLYVDDAPENISAARNAGYTAILYQSNQETISAVDAALKAAPNSGMDKQREEDIQKILRYLQIHDPQNANREYAIQYLDSMEGFGSELARSDESLAEAIKKSLDNKKND
ncbi:MAG TPA: HAD-IA family hydrolase [Candidatus Saccharimonadales bacterium]|nr:HAD-IA family hydrolase [Candidatus Saccharimonadales bacterium]